MPPGRDLWLLFPGPVRRFPADLTLVIAGTVLTMVAVVTPVVNETPIRVVFGLPFVLFLPGYAFIAALFPEAGASPAADNDGEDQPSRLRDRGIDGIERVALSFGLSIAIVPLIGLVLNFTPWGITLGPILLSVGGFTIVSAIVAATRRWELPETDRFRVPFDAWYVDAKTELFEPDSRTDAALNVLLAFSIILAVAAIGYAVAVPAQGEQFTEFYILAEDDDGELVAADYPTEFELGESSSIVLGIVNNEHETVQYTAVVELQRIEFVNESNETRILERSELDRFHTTLAHNETWHQTHTIEPDLVGEDLRLQYLLYVEQVPDDPDEESAYRDLHLWIDVRES